MFQILNAHFKISKYILGLKKKRMSNNLVSQIKIRIFNFGLETSSSPNQISFMSMT